MKKHDKLFNESIKREQLLYIKDNIDTLSQKDKVTVLNIISLDIPPSCIIDNAAGCHAIINDLTKDSIDAIIKIIANNIK